MNMQYDKAVESLELFLQDEDLEDDMVTTAKRLLEYCENGKELVADSIDVVIGSMGEVVNSEHSEQVPLITPDESKLIFTYKGPNSKGDPDAKGGIF